MKTSRRRRALLIAFALVAAGLVACNVLTGLSDDYKLVPADGSVGDSIQPVNPLDGGAESGAVDAPADVFADCWGGARNVTNNYPDLLDTPVPNPRAAPEVVNPSAYDASVPGRVYDAITRLTWLVEADAAAVPYGQQETFAYCATKGARLPSRMELMTLQNWHSPPDAGNGFDETVFKDGPNLAGAVPSYWTSTTTAENAKFRWQVVFGPEGFGTYYPIDPTVSDGFVRCVVGPAGAPPPAHRYEVSEACGFVRDVRTRLDWERGKGPKGTLLTANGHCNALAKMGRNPWRIPTYTELMSIVFTKKRGPAIDPEAFEAEPSAYWTSSRPFRNDLNRIYITFDTGESNNVVNVDKDFPFIRCVRSLDDDQ